MSASSARRPGRGVSALDAFRAVLLGACCVSLLMYGVAEGELSFGLAGGIAACTGWWLTERRGSGLPRWVTGSLVGAGACLTIYQATQPHQVFISIFTGFLASLVVIKLWERRRAKDYGQLLTMAVFLSIGATLNDNGMGVGVLLLLQLPLIVLSVMMLHVVAPRQRALEQDAPAVPPDVRLAGLSRGLALQALLMLVVGGAIAVLVFIFVPRGIGVERLGEFGRVAGRQAGFSDSIELGKGGLISQSQATVLELRLTDARGERAGGLGREVYLRGAVLDTYAAGRWSARPTGATEDEVPAGRHYALEPANGRELVQHVRMRAVGEESPLFASYRPVWVSWSEDARLEYASNTKTLVRRGTPGPVSYSVASVLPRGDEPGFRRRFVPHGPSVRIAQLAASLLTRAGIEPDPDTRTTTEDAAAARVFESYLRTKFAYTTEIQAAPPATEPTEWFLLEQKRGHCEYFASALASLCRAVGIDARVVTGYLASEYDLAKDEYIVRRAHAHAWVEVRTGRDAWTTFDGTPPGEVRVLHAGTSTLSGRLSRWLDGIETIWASAVVSYDNRSQEKLFGSRRDGSAPLDGFSRWVRGRLDGGQEPEPQAEPAGNALFTWGVVLLSGAGLGWIVWREASRRRLHRRLPSGVAAGELGELYEATLRMLAAHGYPKPAWRPGLRFAEEVRAGGEPAGTLAVEAMSVVYGASFGGARVAHADIARLRHRVGRASRTRGGATGSASAAAR